MAAKGAGLAEQSLETLDVQSLTPLSPEVISRQATINIGMCFIWKRLASGRTICGSDSPAVPVD
jgi:hypothetical protein